MSAIPAPRAITNSGLIFTPWVSSSKNRNKPALEAGSGSLLCFFVLPICACNNSSEGLYKNLDYPDEGLGRFPNPIEAKRTPLGMLSSGSTRRPSMMGIPS